LDGKAAPLVIGKLEVFLAELLFIDRRISNATLRVKKEAGQIARCNFAGAND